MQANKIRTGVIFIGFGVAALLYNMGELDGYYFYDLLRLWPILLVAIGIEMISRRSAVPALAYLSPMLVIGAFLYAGAIGNDGWDNDPFSDEWYDGESSLVTNTRSFSLDEPIDEARYYIDLHNGTLDLESGGHGLGRGTFRMAGKLRSSISETDGKAIVRIRQSGSSRHSDAQFDVFLAEDLPLTLDLKGNDCNFSVNCKKLSVRQLYLELSDGDAVVTLGKALESVLAHLRTGDARVRFEIPRAAGLRLEGMAPPRDADFGPFKLRRVDGKLQTLDFDAADVRVILMLEEEISEIEVSAY